MPSARLPRVGAPVVQAYSPLPGTAAASFYEWLQSRRRPVLDMLELLTRRWEPLASFVEVNFLHPEFGPSGALVLTVSNLDDDRIKRRVERLRVIPQREMVDFTRRWEKGETVAVAVADMPEVLARRYATTPIRWSLNVPVRAEGSWVGLVGAATGDRGFVPRAVAGYEAMGEVLMLEYAADQAWHRFRQSTGKRFLQLLR